MTIYMLDQRIWFPDPTKSEKRGIVAVGGDLSLERLSLAYRLGIFPWYSEDEPVIWWCPDPRFVLFPTSFRMYRSLRVILRKNLFTLRFDTEFESVIRHCATCPRPGQPGTWINEDMFEAYLALHHMGLAHSVETFQNGRLVGGLYGVGMGPFFFGESMFNLVPNAAKIALAGLAWRYRGGSFIDCQMHTPFLEQHGGVNLSRELFLRELRERIDGPNHWFREAGWSEIPSERCLELITKS